MKTKRLLLSLGLILCLISLLGCNRKPATGWDTGRDGTVYRDEAGNPVTGWQEIDGKQYFFADNGLLVTGWMELRGMRYYLTEDGPLTGWQEIDGKLYYFQERGSLLTGWAEIAGSRYCFDDEGCILTGWQEIDGHRHYFSDKGVLAIGWQEIGGQQYHFSTSGTLTIGWYTENGYDYYFGADGVMVVGKQEIDGITRYFSPQGVHLLLVNPWNPLPAGFTVDLVYVEDGYQMDVRCYDALVKMLADCRAAGHDPKLVSGYRTQSVQQYLFNVKVNYYLNKGYDLQEAQVEAAKSIAIPGTSEHQIGLAVDILEAGYIAMDDSQANTPTQKWLMEHCHEYGFILRYPEGTTDITGIIYEPWHYRYVGVEVAKDIVEQGVTLEEYLGTVETD